MRNEIVRIYNNINTPDEVKILARMLLEQSGTAGGTQIMKDELQSFIDNNRQFLN